MMAGTVLVTTWDGAGNIPPELGLCRRLADDGHRVHVLTHDSLEQRVTEAGATFVPIVRAGQIDASAAVPEAEGIDKLIANVFLSDGLVADFEQAIDTISPEVVIVDSMMLLPLAVAKQRELVTIGFHHTLASFLLSGQFEMFSTAMKEPFDAALRSRGFSTYERPIDALTQADAILSSTYAEFDSSDETASDPFVYIGPAKGAPMDHEKLRSRLFPSRRLIVVSLSTSFMDQTELLQKLVDALSRLEVEALITTGAAVSPSDLQLPANVSAVEFVSHAAILPDTDLLITHAGHGTVLAGATFGVPMLCLPMGRDQPQVAARAKELGIAHVGDQNASLEELSKAIHLALNDEAMRRSAEEFAARNRQHAGLDAAIECIQRLIAE
jgi:MGT family glycosyltransferase